MTEKEIICVIGGFMVGFYVALKLWEAEEKIKEENNDCS